MKTTIPLIKTWILLLGLLALPLSAMAQISVDLTLDRSTYITHEPVTGKLTIVNRAGRDLILGNNGTRSWLDFSIHDARGNLISPVSSPPSFQPIVIASGQTHNMKVVVNDVYPLGAMGSYRVKASVSFTQINQAFQSREVALTVAEGQVMWNQVVGVPAGYPGAGSYRIFELLTYFHGTREKTLYFRLKNNADGRALRTYALGPFINVRPPAYKVDRSNQLHVVQMVSPKQYFYTVIDVDGEVASRDVYYEYNGSYPTLLANDFGEVELKGGVTEEHAKTPYERREFRLMSERPPSMPRL